MDPGHFAGVVLAALASVMLVKLDGRLLGPYWTFAEIVTGMGGAYSPPLSPAVVARRFLCPFIPALVLNAIVGGTSWLGASAGLTAALLLIWPGILNPTDLPSEARRNSGLLAFIWTGFVLAFALSGFTGGVVGQLLNRAVPQATIKGTDIRDLVIGVLGGLISAGLLALVKVLLTRLGRAAADE